MTHHTLERHAFDHEIGALLEPPGLPECEGRELVTEAQRLGCGVSDEG